MLFNSVSFAIFLPIVFAIYWILPYKYRWIGLLVSSYYFYMSCNIKYVLILIFTTLVSYVAGRLIYSTESLVVKKAIIILSIIAILAVLFVFKYYNFISQSVVEFCSMISIQLHPSTIALVLPVGISFYSFQTIGYITDVYRGKIEPEKNIGTYALFVSFFPQIMSGPIGRADALMPQLKTERKFDYNQATDGLKLMAWGFFKKLCISDTLAMYVDTVYTDVTAHAGFDFVLVIFFYTIQIYCDFSGYTDIAIGVAKLFGIELMTNFKSPFLSKSIKEFWSRWHISLSTWFRDYVYIPLGGSRCSKAKTYRNLIITFLVSGLWHGANWTFIFWGGLHGVLQVVEKALDRPIKKIKTTAIGRALSLIVVFVLCSVAWVFFRADNFGQAVYVLTHIFDGITNPASYFTNTIGLGGSKYLTLVVSVGLLTVYDYLDIHGGVINTLEKKPAIVRHGCYIILLLMIMFLKAAGEADFVYFQF